MPLLKPAHGLTSLPVSSSPPSPSEAQTALLHSYSCRQSLQSGMLQG
jgi:hypothetical protein